MEAAKWISLGNRFIDAKISLRVAMKTLFLAYARHGSYCHWIAGQTIAAVSNDGL